MRLQPGDIVLPSDIGGAEVQVIGYVDVDAENAGYWCEVIDEAAAEEYRSSLYDSEELFGNGYDVEFTELGLEMDDLALYYWLPDYQAAEAKSKSGGQHKIIPTHFLQNIKL